MGRTVEREFIQWLRTETQARQHPDMLLGIGDDAAIVDFQSGSTVISTDMLADGTHFILGQTPLELIGRKSMAVNLSDMAAMAARPVCAVVSLMIPKTMSLDDLKTLYGGMLKIADEYGVAIAGGDTNRWDDSLVINVAITGTLDDANPCADGWKMDGALVDDVILVSGDFGHSIKQKHLEFTPRVALALYLRDRYSIHAATDITDSLTIDLAAIASHSRGGMILQKDSIPISKDALDQFESDPKAAIDSALYDGEDFELAFVVDRETANRILKDQEIGCQITEIGKITEDKRCLISDAEGNVRTLPLKGYEH